MSQFLGLIGNFRFHIASRLLKQLNTLAFPRIFNFGLRFDTFVSSRVLWLLIWVPFPFSHVSWLLIAYFCFFSSLLAGCWLSILLFLMSSSCGLDIFALSYVFWLLIGYFSLLSRLPAADWIPFLFLTIKNELFRSVQLKDARTPSVWSFLNVAFETVPVFVISRKIVERFLFPSLSLPGDRCCDVLDFVPAGSVSSSSTLQIFRDAN